MSKTKFPASRAGQIALAQAIINGFTVNTTDFPSPPTPANVLQTLLDAAISKRNARITADAAAKEAGDEEFDAFEELTDAMKDDIKYAELVTKGNDAKLQEINWSGRAARKALQVPGAPNAFEAFEQGKGSASFDWKESKTGGKASMFRIMMMEVGGAGTWKEAASSVQPQNTVSGLESGKEYIFCAVAVNSAGVSEQSNAVTLFL